MKTKRNAVLACSIALLSLPALAQTNATARPTLPTIMLNVDASRPAPNDMGQVNVYVEDTGANPADLAKRVNQRISDALAVAKGYNSVKTQSAGTQTWPVYTKNSTKIESWRMRSELSLQSKDLAALSELTGKLQSSMVVQQLNLMPSPETAKRITDDTIVDAIRAFEARADVAAKALGKKYRIKELNINTNGVRPVYMRKNMVAMDSAGAAPAPIEAGDSQMTVNINGTVELVD